MRRRTDYRPLKDDSLRRFCTADDAATLLGVTRWGVRYLCNAGELTLLGVTLGGTAIFRLYDVQRLASVRADARARAAAAALVVGHQAAAASRAEQRRLEQREARLARVDVKMIRAAAAPKPLHNGGVTRARGLNKTSQVA